MSRVVIAPEAVRGGLITIADRPTLHHLRDVARVKVGDRIECVDGAGRRYEGTVRRSSPDELTVDVERTAEEAPQRLQIVLAQALIKPERFEWLIEKATELGIARVLPMVTERTTVRHTVGEARLERWRRIIASAAAQCGRATLPVLEPPARFERILEAHAGRPLLLPTLGPDALPLADGLSGLARSSDLLVLIGPEGDFTAREVSLARQGGARIVRLGPLTLRSETAAVAVLAILQHALCNRAEDPV